MKYQRDISSILKFLALALVLFIGYHTWLKPAYLTSGPVSRQTSEPLPLQRPPSFALPGTHEYPSWDVPQSRLIDLGQAPTDALGIIRDEVDKGNFREAERRLMALSNKRVGKAEARRYTASLWNNLGVQQEKFGGSALSVKAFKKAVASDPSQSTRLHEPDTSVLGTPRPGNDISVPQQGNSTEPHRSVPSSCPR